MVALSSLLYLAPVLLALGSASAAPTPEDVTSVIEAHRAVIEAYRADHTDAPPAPAAAAAVAVATAPAASPASTAPVASVTSSAIQDPKDILAARQYDPSKPKGPQRIVRRALNSVQPAPNSVSNNGVHLAKFYEGAGYTETDHNPSECSVSHAILSRSLWSTGQGGGRPTHETARSPSTKPA